MNVLATIVACAAEEGLPFVVAGGHAVIVHGISATHLTWAWLYDGIRRGSGQISYKPWVTLSTIKDQHSFNSTLPKIHPLSPWI